MRSLLSRVWSETLEPRLVFTPAVPLLPLGPAADSPATPFVFQGSLIIAAGRFEYANVYRSDGTTAGTVPLSQTSPALSTLLPSSGTPFVVGDKLIVTKDTRLWVSDGTTAGTHIIVTAPTFKYNDFDATVIDGKAYFIAYDSQNRMTLWVSDGTDAGTRALSAQQAVSDAEVSLAGVIGSSAYFTQITSTGQSNLYRSDGYTATLVATLPSGITDALATDLTALNATQQIFALPGPSGVRLFITDGTQAGTRAIDTTVKFLSKFSVLDGVAYFSGQDSASNTGGLYRTDGTRAGTYRVDLSGIPVAPLPLDAVAQVFAGHLYLRVQGASAALGQVYVRLENGTYQWLAETSVLDPFDPDGNRMFIGGLRDFASTDAPTTLARSTDGPSDKVVNHHFVYLGTYYDASANASLPTLLTKDLSGTPTGSFAGYLYNDVDGDGVRSSTEPGIANATVYLDLNSNGTFDSATEPSFVSKSNGFYEFMDAPAGDWPISVVAQPGVLQPGPTASVDVIEDQYTSGSTFLASYGRRLTGVVYRDANANGHQDAGEAGLSGVKVFASADPSATTALSTDSSSVTDSAGRYILQNVGAHGYLRVQPPTAAYRVVQPALATDDLPTGYVGVLPGPAIAVASPSPITLHFNADVNGDGLQTAADALTSDFRLRVYIDLNRNGLFDTGEPTTQASDGANLSNVPAGAQLLRVVPPQGWTTSLGDNAIEIDIRSGVTTQVPSFTLTAPIASVAGVVRGRIAENADFDAGVTSNDTGVRLALVWDDANANGVRETSEAYTYTTATGDYVLTDLPAGVRRIGFSATGYTPASGVNSYLSVDTAVPVVRDIALYSTSRQVRVSGQVRLDANNNGVIDDTDPPLANASVTSSLWPTPVVTDSQGRYVALVPAGRHTPYVTQLPTIYSNVSSVLLPTLVTGQTFDTSLILVRGPSTALGNVSGVVFKDDNFNGVRDQGEAGLAGVLVWADLDLNGTLNNEPNTRTAADGTYTMTGVPQQSFDLRLSLTAPVAATNALGNRRQVTLIGTQLTGQDFGAATGAPVSGTVYNDYDRDGTRGAFDTGRANVLVWADLNGNGQLDWATDPFAYTNFYGVYTLQSLAPNAAVTLYVEPPTSAFTAIGGNSKVVAAGPAGVTRQADFFISNNTSVIGGQVYFDRNQNGTLDANEAQSGGTVTLRNPSTNAVIATTTVSSTDLYFRFSSLQPGTYLLTFAPANNDVRQGNGGVIVTLGAGEVSASTRFGYYPVPVQFIGTVYIDPNNNSGDIYPDADDVPAVGVRAFLDTDHDQLYDPGEPTGLTDESGRFTITAPYKSDGSGYNYSDGLIVLNPAGYLKADNYRYPLSVSGSPTAPTNVGTFLFAPPKGLYINGYVYEDRNTNGVRDAGEPGIPYVGVGTNFTAYSNDVKLTDQNGYYVYHVENSSSSYYNLRTNLSNPYLSTDGSGVKPALQNTQADFGFVAWRLGGYAFVDANRNGVFDAGESPVVGRRVWLDADRDGLLDVNETAVITASDGFYSFANIGGGTYRIAEEMPGDTPAATLDYTLAESQAKGGLSFANAPAAPVALSNVTIDDGTAQRSRVRSITLTFDGVLTLPDFATRAFSLTRNGNALATPTIESITTLNGNRTSVRLSFAGAGGPGGSLPNGRYALTINGSFITGAGGMAIDAAGNGVAGSARVTEFTCLFGDADGNAAVNFNDFLALQNAFGSHAGDASFLAGLDSDANDQIDFNDFLALQNQFGQTV